MGSLPYGLKQVIKKDIDLNQFQLIDFLPVDELPTNSKYEDLEREDKNNMVSLLKPREG